MKKIPPLMLIFMLLACGSSRHATGYTGYEEILFSESGGFAGSRTDFSIRDSSLYRMTGTEDSGELVRHIPTPALREIDSLVQMALLAQDTADYSPGNLNRSIRIKTAREEKAYRWGIPGNRPPQPVQALFEVLMALP